MSDATYPPRITMMIMEIAGETQIVAPNADREMVMRTLEDALARVRASEFCEKCGSFHAPDGGS
jgi:hypothetical protein